MDVVIDVPGYTRDMLSSMMQMARENSAPHIAEGLGKVMKPLAAIVAAVYLFVPVVA